MQAKEMEVEKNANRTYGGKDAKIQRRKNPNRNWSLRPDFLVVISYNPVFQLEIQFTPW